jgi:predicted permease
MRFRKALVVAQVALSLLLLVGAGLFSRSLHNLRTLQPGFETDGLITFSVDASLNGYRGPRALALYEGIQEKLALAPGVAGVSLATEPMLSNSIWRSTVKVDGYQPHRDEDMNPQVNAVGTGFFAALKLPVVQGREFTPADAPGAPRVAVVNEEFARYFYGGRSPLGRRFGFGRDAGTEIVIVGMVKDARADGPRRKVPRWVYVPYAQQGAPAHDSYNNATFYVRATGDAAALAASVRQVVRRADPNLPVVDMRTLREQADRLLFLDRLVAGLSTAFGLLATVLAAVGLYGVMSYAVVQRTREIGIRMALGAERRMVLWLVMREVAVMAVLGIVLGLPGAVGLARLASSQLFGLSPSDPLTLSLATATLTLVAALAGYLPARRATRIDPFAALRCE